MSTAHTFSPSVRNQNQTLRTAAVRNAPCPTLLIARRMIVQAFHDAMQCRQGEPTEHARDAFDWLTAKTDWTLRGSSAPPVELRQEFPGTFEWACRWLGENPDRVRRQGLVMAHGVGFTGGLSAVAQAWQRNAKGNGHGRAMIDDVISQRLSAML